MVAQPPGARHDTSIALPPCIRLAVRTRAVRARRRRRGPRRPRPGRASPARPIHIVIPFPAGGPSDIAARIIAQKMNEDWGQPVVVDNRPGANTIIGAETVAKAAPD